MILGTFLKQGVLEGLGMSCKGTCMNTVPAHAILEPSRVDCMVSGDDLFFSGHQGAPNQARFLGVLLRSSV